MAGRRRPPGLRAELSAIMSRDAVLADALGRGIVNYRALARWLDATYGLGASEEALVSAIRRLPRPGHARPFDEAYAVLARSHLNVRSRACQVVASRSEAVQKRLPAIVDAIDLAAGEMLYYTQGDTGVKIVVDESNLGAVRSALGQHVRHVERDLSAIVVVEPEDGLQVPGILAVLTNVLALQRINVFDAMFGYPEFIFFLRSADTLRGYEALAALITTSRTRPRLREAPRAATTAPARRRTSGRSTAR